MTPGLPGDEAAAGFKMKCTNVRGESGFPTGAATGKEKHMPFFEKEIKKLYVLYGDKARAAHEEDWLVSGHGKKRASECIQCGRCEAACPQHIQIREELVKVAELFS